MARTGSSAVDLIDFLHSYVKNKREGRVGPVLFSKFYNSGPTNINTVFLQFDFGSLTAREPQYKPEGKEPVGQAQIVGAPAFHSLMQVTQNDSEGLDRTAAAPGLERHRTRVNAPERVPDWLGRHGLAGEHHECEDVLQSAKQAEGVAGLAGQVLQHDLADVFLVEEHLDH